jgi:iron-sulfur cluster assembly protein
VEVFVSARRTHWSSIAASAQRSWPEARIQPARGPGHPIQEETMLGVSEEAKDLLERIAQTDDRVPRLEPSGDGNLMLAASEPNDDDQVVEHHGREVLRISSAVSHRFDGASLRRVDTPEGPKISLTRSGG